MRIYKCSNLVTKHHCFKVPEKCFIKQNQLSELVCRDTNALGKDNVLNCLIYKLGLFLGSVTMVILENAMPAKYMY